MGGGRAPSTYRPGTPGQCTVNVRVVSCLSPGTPAAPRPAGGVPATPPEQGRPRLGEQFQNCRVVSG